jgi:hypothetical protein
LSANITLKFISQGDDMQWNFQFRTYQDVKNILHTYTYFVSIIFSIVIYFLVLSPENKTAIDSLFGIISPLLTVGVFLSLIFGFIISFFLIHVFEAHDKVYDRYVKKWRYKYSRDYMIPELFKPFSSKLDKQFFSVAGNNMRDTMNVFYYFAGDYNIKIRQTLVVRFYDAIWKYWATQINELLLILLVIFTFTYGIINYSDSLTSKNWLWVLVSALIVMLINIGISIYFLKFVKVATQEEIDDIHQNFSQELENQTRQLSAKLGLRYDGN